MNVQFKSIHNNTVNLGIGTGNFKLYWDVNTQGGPNPIPARVILKWDSTTLDTGFRGSSEYNSLLNSLGHPSVVDQSPNGFLTLIKNKETPTTATITLYTPIEESLMKVELVCPDNDSLDSDEPCLPNNSFFTLISNKDTQSCCRLPGNPSTTGFGETSDVVINGQNYTITASGSGYLIRDMTNYQNDCCLIIGGLGGIGGEFSYTLTFDKPINDVYFRWDLANRNEELFFETNVGTPQIISEGFQPMALIEGNKISPVDKSGMPGTGLQGMFKINAPNPFTTLTMNGPGDCIPIN